MKSGDIVVDKTSFIYEDGNTYYFDIISRGSASYHDLFVYTRKEVEKKVRVGTEYFFFPVYETKLVGKYKTMNSNDGALVGTELKLSNIKGKIKEIIRAHTKSKIEGWDGIVGDVPDHLRDRLTRDNKLNDILDNMIDED
jgi:hypothetical protein